MDQNAHRTVDSFLFTEWRYGHVVGVTPAEAYFVPCGRTTMTQNDLGKGRLVLLIDVAPLQPAEFVVLRIGWWMHQPPAPSPRTLPSAGPRLR